MMGSARLLFRKGNHRQPFAVTFELKPTGHKEGNSDIWEKSVYAKGTVIIKA